MIRNSNFSFSIGMFGRFKSSDSRIENNRFVNTNQEELELLLLPSFYEGPMELSNVTVTGNTFSCSGGATSMSDIVAIMPDATGVATDGNHIVKGGG